MSSGATSTGIARITACGSVTPGIEGSTHAWQEHKNHHVTMPGEHHHHFTQLPVPSLCLSTPEEADLIACIKVACFIGYAKLIQSALNTMPGGGLLALPVRCKNIVIV
jgi:hypothetical protein